MAQEKIDKKLKDGVKTSSELSELKKKLADKIADKVGVPSVLKQRAVEYLVDKGTLFDLARDKLIDKAREGVSSLIPALDEYRKDLDGYRKELSKLKTKSELEDFYAKNFDDKGGLELDSSNTQESGTNTSSSTDTPSSSNESDNKSDNESKNDSGSKEEKSDDSKKPDEKQSDKSVVSAASNEKAKVSDSKESHEIDNIKINVSPENKKIYESLKGVEKPSEECFATAWTAYNAEKKKGRIKNTKYLGIVDFTKNQIKDNRYWLLNTETLTIEDAEKCGHGQGSGGAEYANSFSNVKGSLQSSQGMFVTSDEMSRNGKHTWRGLKMKGLQWCNDNAAGRGIFFHGVRSETYKSGKPTSQGCFTIEGNQAKIDGLCDKIKGGSALFAFAKVKSYFDKCEYFPKNSDGSYQA